MKTLVIGPAWVGDMVMAQTLFSLLHQQNPTNEIHVLAPAWSQPLLDRMPEVAKGLTSPFGHGQLQLKQRYQFAKKLRETGYQQAILCPNSLKSALIPAWANIPKRTGWRGEYRFGLLNDLRYLDKKKLSTMTQRFAALAFSPNATLPMQLPKPKLNISSVSVDQALQKQGLTRPTKPLLVLCPGAEFGPSKRWPTKYYATVANQKLSEGWDVWLFGSANDQAVTNEIQSKTQGRCVNLAGCTSLSEAVDLLSLATVVVTNDSGLMHISAAVGRSVIAVYGSSSPHFTPPLTDKATILHTDVACRPCFKRTCPLKHHDCMEKLMPHQVLSTIDASVATV